VRSLSSVFGLGRRAVVWLGCQRAGLAGQPSGAVGAIVVAAAVAVAAGPPAQRQSQRFAPG